MTTIESDITIIGAGPAGMIAAGRSAEILLASKEKKKVILLEKNPQPGSKLLLTGHGRCNLTTAIDDVDILVDRIARNGEFLYSAFYKFGVIQTIEFFKQLGLELKEERGKRIFPLSDSAQSVVDILREYLNDNNVELHLNTAVKTIEKKENYFEIKTEDSVINSTKVIIATGGLSYPLTGSTGDGYSWARSLGHTIQSPRPALVPVIVQESWISHLQGLSLKNVAVSVYQNNKKKLEQFGEALFTDTGMSGPVIIDMSEKIDSLLQNGKVELRIDFKPALSFEQLDQRIQRDFDQNGKKMFKNILEGLLPQKAISTFITLSGISAGKQCNQISGVERKKLTNLLKSFTLNVDGLEDIKQAVVTAGGVNLKEIDPTTMQSKLVDGLFFAGEVLDVHGPTGGFNLQICWSSGYVAGESAASS